jgi:hypothetical protein
MNWAKIWPLGVIPLGLAGCDPRCSLEDVLAAESAGANAIDCGYVARDRDRTEINACVTAALQANLAFEVRYELQGIDSHIVEAFVGLGDGRVVRLDYDGHIDGGLFHSWEYVRRYTCGQPLLPGAPNGDFPPFECEPWVGREKVCETKGLTLWFASSDQN